MLKVVKRDEDEFQSWLKKQEGAAASKLESMGLNPIDILSTEVGWLISIGRYEQVGLELDPHQINFLSQKKNMRSILKARQVGFSFNTACEALARSHLRSGHTAVFTSYNLDDAKEKIKKLRELYDELPLEFQKKIIASSKTEVIFAPRSRKSGGPSRVLSYPSKAPRGKTGDIYLDELAHCQNDREIYNGATALILRSNGQLTIGSTPLGKRGIFYEIHSQDGGSYPGYWRQEVPWWLCSHVCVDIRRASREAPFMSTNDRVQEFGTRAIKDQFDMLPLDQFQQEYEMLFVDESVSFFPYSVISPCATKEADELPVYTSVEVLAQKAKEESLVAGFDVGRTNHPSELAIFEEKNGSYSMRYQTQFRKMPFPEQRARIKAIMKTLGGKIRILQIDETGLGRNLVEDLKRERSFGRKVRGVSFTGQSKEEMANNLKILMLDRKIELPKDRDIISQIHSIKQTITASGNAIFKSEETRKHHSDKMWAIALAVYDPNTKKKRKEPRKIDLRVIGMPEDGDSPNTRAIPEKPARSKSVIEQLFDTSSQKPIEPILRRLEANVASDRSTLKNAARTLLEAAKVWKDCGREDKAYELISEYKRLRAVLKDISDQ